MDELLNGLHPEAKRIVMDIVQIFAEEGFQFVMVEYGVDDKGRIYLVEKPNEIATVTPFDGVYHNEIFVFNRPPEEVDLSIRVDEESEIPMTGYVGAVDGTANDGVVEPDIALIAQGMMSTPTSPT